MTRVPPFDRGRPAALWASSVLIVALGIVAFLRGGLAQPAFAAFCALTAAVPLRATSTAQERATLIAYGFGSWSLFGLAPVVSIGEPLGGPYGGHPLVFAFGLVLSIVRIRALGSQHAVAWFRPRP
jgi:hypothetical protein